MAPEGGGGVCMGGGLKPSPQTAEEGVRQQSSPGGNILIGLWQQHKCIYNVDCRSDHNQDRPTLMSLMSSAASAAETKHVVCRGSHTKSFVARHNSLNSVKVVCPLPLYLVPSSPAGWTTVTVFCPLCQHCSSNLQLCSDPHSSRCLLSLPDRMSPHHKSPETQENMNLSCAFNNTKSFTQ